MVQKIIIRLLNELTASGEFDWHSWNARDSNHQNRQILDHGYLLDSSQNVQCPPSVFLDYICKTVEFRSIHVQGWEYNSVWLKIKIYHKNLCNYWEKRTWLTHINYIFQLFEKNSLIRINFFKLIRHLLPFSPKMESSRPIGPLLLRSVDAFETFYLWSPDCSIEPW